MLIALFVMSPITFAISCRSCTFCKSCFSTRWFAFFVSRESAVRFSGVSVSILMLPLMADLVVLRSLSFVLPNKLNALLIACIGLMPPVPALMLALSVLISLRFSISVCASDFVLKRFLLSSALLSMMAAFSWAWLWMLASIPSSPTRIPACSLTCA